MIRQFTPQLIDAATEIVKDSIRTYLGHRAANHPNAHDAPTITVSRPYGYIACQLAIAHRYVLRIKERPDLAETYTELAAQAIDDALAVSKGMGNLVMQLKGIHNQLLLRPITPDNRKAVVQLIWRVSSHALDLDEATNG